MRKHPGKLTDGQRHQLHKLIRSGQAPARKLTHARILLKADAGELDTKTSQALDVSIATIWRVRKRFGQEGFDSRWLISIFGSSSLLAWPGGSPPVHAGL